MWRMIAGVKPHPPWSGAENRTVFPTEGACTSLPDQIPDLAPLLPIPKYSGPNSRSISGAAEWKSGPFAQQSDGMNQTQQEAGLVEGPVSIRCPCKRRVVWPSGELFRPGGVRRAR